MTRKRRRIFSPAVCRTQDCRASAGRFLSNGQSRKNPVEISGIEAAHLRDGVAMVRFLHWLSGNWPGKTELDVVKNCMISALKGKTTGQKVSAPLPPPARTAPSSIISPLPKPTGNWKKALCFCSTAVHSISTERPTLPAPSPSARQARKCATTSLWF